MCLRSHPFLDEAFAIAHDLKGDLDWRRNAVIYLAEEREWLIERLYRVQKDLTILS